MGLFKKSPESQYCATGKKIKKLEKKLENFELTEKQEEKIQDKISVLRDKRRIAYKKSTTPAPQTKNTQINVAKTQVIVSPKSSRSKKRK